MEDADRAAVPLAVTSPWNGAVERTLAPGEILVHEGDTGDEVYEVVSGTLEILRGPDLKRIDVVGPAGTVGEIAAIAGFPRTATVRALERSVIRGVDGPTYQHWLADHERVLQRLTDVARSRLHRQRTIEMVMELLGVGQTTAADVVDAGDWLHVAAGDVVCTQGDPSDAAFLVVSGRLRAIRDGVPIGEAGRSELVGEVGLIQRSPRTATVVALRDSTLCRFTADAFNELTMTHPILTLHVARTILARLARPHGHTERARSISITVLAPLDPSTCVAHLTAEIGRHGRVGHLSASRVDSAFARPGMVATAHPANRPAIFEHVQEVEANHDFLVLETDLDDTWWTRQSLAIADRIVVVMPASPGPDERRRAAAVLAAAPPGAGAERWLVLIQRSNAERPVGAAVADELGCDRLAHVRAGSKADLDRVARLVSGTAIGLVLGGGGARGFAHLGVWRALHELGVEVDTIGGTSIGAALGAVMALQLPPDDLVPMVSELFRDLLDYTIPVVSIVKGERITRNISRVFGGVDVRDLWLPFFCVSTNLTRSRVEVHDRGDTATAIRASVALPGILPPVVMGGDLLVDGGVLNNLPCDVMRAARTVGRLIAVDLSPSVGLAAQDDHGLTVSGWRALRGYVRSREAGYPRVVTIVMRAVVAGSVRSRDRMLADGSVDWYLDLDLRGVQLLQFDRVAEIAERGYDAARPRLEALLADAGRFSGTPDD